jgi:hypothetical protein
MLTAEERSLRGQIAAHTMRARYSKDELARIANKGLIERFEREADPEGVLTPEERRRRANHLYQAHMARMRLAQLKAERLAGVAS